MGTLPLLDAIIGECPPINLFIDLAAEKVVNEIKESILLYIDLMTILASKNLNCLFFLLISFGLEIISTLSYIFLFLIELKNKKSNTYIDIADQEFIDEKLPEVKKAN